jgi:hypothetical protein
MPTQGLTMMPTVGKAAKPPQPKQQPTRAEAVRAANENNAEQFSAEAAGCPKGLDIAAVVSGIDFVIQVVKVRQPLHRQVMFVSFTLDVRLHQMLGKPLMGTP